MTPFEHEFAVTDVTDGSLIFKANVPICFLATVVGSAMMLGVNGLTWWRMWIAYRKLKKARQAYYQGGTDWISGSVHSRPPDSRETR